MKEDRFFFLTIEVLRVFNSFIISFPGNYYSLRSQHEKAVLYFQRALKLNPKYLAAWTLMGHEYMELKHTSAAIQAYRQAIGLFHSSVTDVTWTKRHWLNPVFVLCSFFLLLLQLPQLLLRREIQWFLIDSSHVTYCTLCREKGSYPIFKMLSLLNRESKCQHNLYSIFHQSIILLLHYLLKRKAPHLSQIKAKYILNPETLGFKTSWNVIGSRVCFFSRFFEPHFFRETRWSIS